jgi:hypothetical protein
VEPRGRQRDLARDEPGLRLFEHPPLHPRQVQHQRQHGDHGNQSEQQPANDADAATTTGRR